LRADCVRTYDKIVVHEKTFCDRGSGFYL